MNIGENIRKIRKAKGMTMKELGQKIDISEQGVGNYERGDRQPNIDILIKISKALDTPIAYILFDSDSENTIDDYEIIQLMESLKQHGIDMYQKPSTERLSKYHKKLHGAIFDMLKNEVLQNEFDYEYDDLWSDEIGTLTAFILDMLELKINEIKYKRLINDEYGIKAKNKKQSDNNTK